MWGYRGDTILFTPFSRTLRTGCTDDLINFVPLPVGLRAMRLSMKCRGFLPQLLSGELQKYDKHNGVS